MEEENEGRESDRQGEVCDLRCDVARTGCGPPDKFGQGGLIN